MATHKKIVSRLVALSLRASRLIELKAQDLGCTYDEKYGSSPCLAAPKMPEKMYPSMDLYDHPAALDLPDTGKATIEYVVTRRSIDERDGKKRHGYTLKIKSIDTAAPKKKERKPKEGQAANQELSALRPGMIELDSRPRNDVGEYASTDGGTISPEQVHAAYREPRIAGGGGSKIMGALKRMRGKLAA